MNKKGKGRMAYQAGRLIVYEGEFVCVCFMYACVNVIMVYVCVFMYRESWMGALS